MSGAVTDSERKYRTLVEHLNIGVFLTSLDGKLLHANAAVIRMAGYESLEEFMAQPAQSLYANPEDRRRFVELLGRDGEVRSFETTSVRKDGTLYPIRLGAVLLRDANGAPEFLLGTTEDISERKQAEAKLALLKSSIDNAPDGAYWFDSNWQLVYTNEAGCRMLGYTPEEMSQLSLLDINPRATRERLAERWQAVKASTTISFETEHRRKDGSLFPVELTCTYFVSDGREYCNGYATDITKRKQAEREREALQSQLVQAQKMESIGRLAGGVAHDFNNMLSVILGHADLALSELTPSDKLHRDIEQIRSAAERSAALAGQLLAFARRQTTEPKVLDLNRATSNMLDLLRRLIGEQIQLEFLAGAPLWQVKIDPVQLQQILTNLCVNARDAIDGVGTITIETACVNESVRLSVKDTGKGVAEELKERLFEPFFTTKPAGRGTGLGLATVWGIVHQNGGSIDVQSAAGQGSTFNVYLPKHVGNASAAPSGKAGHQRGAGERLLLVEDEEAILDVEQRILERLGYQVIRAATPQQALNLAEAQPDAIDLLLTDVIMPEMNGRELAGRLAGICPGLPTLYLSGYPADVIANHGVLEPGVHFLQKPFTVQAISEKVSEMLALRRTTRTL